MKHFANKLKAARKHAGKTQAWMAQHLNLHRTTYTKYETGQSEPSLEVFGALVKLLNVDPMELLE